MVKRTSDQHDLAPPVLAAVAAADPDLAEHKARCASEPVEDLADALYATPADPHHPSQIFPKLRWGGQFIFLSRDQKQVQHAAHAFAPAGFEITQAPRSIYRRLRLPLVGRKTHYFVARKVQLVLPGEFTERFTYHVYLTRASHRREATNGESYVVAKEVPSLETVMERLRRRWPDLDPAVLEKRARKFSDKIFPIFLTREAAILMIVNRDLPADYRGRMPKVLHVEKDDRGYVRKLHLSWLRNGGEPLSQLEFARQSADLLRVLHDEVGVMHLDLRLDNFVITPAGVGFVDFGSAVRVNENLDENPLLSNLFEELMKTSEIQRMLYSMTRSGQVTSRAISCGLHKTDKAVDCFYLAVQMSAPHANPDLRDLIRFDPNGREAKALAKLTDQILRPMDPLHPTYRTAADILRGIDRLGRGPERAVAG